MQPPILARHSVWMKQTAIANLIDQWILMRNVTMLIKALSGVQAGIPCSFGALANDIIGPIIYKIMTMIS
jgi:hypothetical protein